MRALRVWRGSGRVSGVRLSWHDPPSVSAGPHTATVTMPRQVSSSDVAKYLESRCCQALQYWYAMIGDRLGFVDLGTNSFVL